MIIKVVKFEIFSIFNIIFENVLCFAAICGCGLIDMSNAAILVNPILLENQSVCLTQLGFQRCVI